MKVTIIDCTGFDDPRHAENVLMLSKNTRLMGDPVHDHPYGQVNNIDGEVRNAELEAIAKTIPSSWEFVHYTFLIQDVTRAFTHQLVRTRTASYAQQALRIVGKANFQYLPIPGLPPDARKAYREGMGWIQQSYNKMIEADARVEEARGLLPTNVLTNIMMSANLRTVVELVRKRSSPRVQDEYRQFIDNVQIAVEGMHPFTCQFFGVNHHDLRKEIECNLEGLDASKRVTVNKLIDKLVETMK